MGRQWAWLVVSHGTSKAMADISGHGLHALVSTVSHETSVAMACGKPWHIKAMARGKPWDISVAMAYTSWYSHRKPWDISGLRFAMAHPWLWLAVRQGTSVVMACGKPWDISGHGLRAGIATVSHGTSMAMQAIAMDIKGNGLRLAMGHLSVPGFTMTS
eukprot:g4122.t1